MPKRLGSEIPELPEFGLRTLFGDTVRTRILDFLTLYRDSSYSKSEISRNSHVSWRRFNQVFPEFVRLGLVKQVGVSGSSKLFKYSNPSNVTAHYLVKLSNQIAVDEVKRELKSSYFFFIPKKPLP